MIKCPNCGSTAQVQKMGSYDKNNVLTERFECGCGCRFNKNYYWCGDVIYLTDIKVINNDK